MPYELWYWTGIPGRGEFVRLALEAAGVPYKECARDPAIGDEGLMKHMKSAKREQMPFAPPYLVADDITIAQTANILLFLGEQHGLGQLELAGLDVLLGLGARVDGGLDLLVEGDLADLQVLQPDPARLWRCRHRVDVERDGDEGQVVRATQQRGHALGRAGR